MIVILEDTKYASIYDTVHLICYVYSNPDSSIDWFHEDKLVKETTSLQALNELTEIGHVEKSKLTVYLQSKSQLGRYRCQATNNLGISQKAITLKEKSKSGRVKRDLKTIIKVFELIFFVVLNKG